MQQDNYFYPPYRQYDTHPEAVSFPPPFTQGPPPGYYANDQVPVSVYNGPYQQPGFGQYQSYGHGYQDQYPGNQGYYQDLSYTSGRGRGRGYLNNYRREQPRNVSENNNMASAEFQVSENLSEPDTNRKQDYRKNCQPGGHKERGVESGGLKESHTRNQGARPKQRGWSRGIRQQQAVEYYSREVQEKSELTTCSAQPDTKPEDKPEDKNYSELFQDKPNKQNSKPINGGPANKRNQSSYGSYYDGPHIQQSKNWQRQNLFKPKPYDEEDHMQQEDVNKEGKRGGKKVGDIKFKDQVSKSRTKKESGSNYQRRYQSSKKVNKEDGETQRGSLIEQLSNSTYECMVCCDVVRCEAAIWSCQNCYHIFHLRCIKKWARSPNAIVDGQAIGGWRCPACQNVSSQFPNQYRCFCGKVRDPEFVRQDTPHSCGEVCHKKRPGDCAHPCYILCHPGPCPPCQATVNKHCDCKKTKQVVKCGQSSSLKCTKECSKVLNCGKHICKQICHPGSCDPCEDIVEQDCYCQKTKREVVCGSSESFVRQFSCAKTCERLLQCDHHQCEDLCHPGTCPACKLLPSARTHCHCGQTLLAELLGDNPRTACTDPIPSCDKICAKPLPCGPPEQRHQCERGCHEGSCGPCSGITDVSCRCGIYSKEFTCIEASLFTAERPFTCDKRCNKKKTCGRHKCSQPCCVDMDHVCQQICGQKLTCAQHRCEEPCHRGNCPPCWQVSFDELRCLCGAEVLYPPIACGTRPPECGKLCTRHHACDHPVRHTCHCEENCPPCTELTERWCLGKHELRKNIPCYLTEISCGLPCNMPLPCGQHVCQSPCHKGECLAGQQCKQLCVTQRETCGHPCAAPCHGNDACPKTVCQSEVIIKCKCGNRTERTLCQAGTEEFQDYQKLAVSMLAMRMADVQSGQSIDISNFTADKKKSANELECNSDCALKERNRRLALALEIKNPDMRAKLQHPPYSDFLRCSAKQYPKFVAGVEKTLSELVQKVEEGKLPKRSHSFPSMPMVQRKVIHELAEFYGCETQSFDQEPNKNVVATANKGKCWHPKESLTYFIQRELHPKAPPPIPLGSKEHDIRSSVQAVRQGTNVMGATGWSTARIPAPRSNPTAGVGATRGSWASLVKTKPQSSPTDPPPVTTSRPSFVSLSKLKQDKESDKVIDYFDME